jgi:hypothetical protein
MSAAPKWVMVYGKFLYSKTVKKYRHYIYFDIILRSFALVKQEFQNSRSSRFWPHIQTPAVPKQVMGYGKYLSSKKIKNIIFILI